MRHVILVASIVWLISSCSSPLPDSQEKPKLVVGIVVDQMRYDFLMRYRDYYGADGFNRLLNSGYQFKNAHYNYIPTKTGPGHASIFTGTTPSKHGIIGNDWYLRGTNQTINCVEDTAYAGVGGAAKSGQVSPQNMKTTTITDELRMYSNFRSKVIGISIKDRGAVLPAGHNPTGAYWFDNSSGLFMTSTYFEEELPQWVQDFNAENKTAEYLQKGWQQSQTYEESLPDKNAYEAESYKGSGIVFPYNTSDKDPHVIRMTPYSNIMLREFAEAAIEGEGLGQGNLTDFLTVSFSATDDIGHRFGPRSQEIQDLYIKLDQEIAQLLTFLDQQVGKDAYTVFLTADHGIVDVPQYLVDHKMPGGYLNNKSLEEGINSTLKEQFGVDQLIERLLVENIYINNSLAAENDLDIAEIQSAIVKYLLKQPYVLDAQAATDIAKRQFTDPFLLHMQNGYHSQLSGDVVFLLSSGYLNDSYGHTGTDHRSGYNYDTHVPILFYGKNIPAGSTVRKVHVIDIAPTVSHLLDISLPSAATGEPLIELFK